MIVLHAYSPFFATFQLLPFNKFDLSFFHLFAFLTFIKFFFIQPHSLLVIRSTTDSILLQYQSLKMLNFSIIFHVIYFSGLCRLVASSLSFL